MGRKETFTRKPARAPQRIAFFAMLAAAVAVYFVPLALDLLRVNGLSGGGEGRAFPSRPITIIAPASPGGGWDQLARLMQHVLTVDDISPVPVEVVNRGGAGGTIGLAELITQHRTDPYTLMVGGSTLVSALIMHDSRFNLNEVDLLARLASEYNVVAVPYDSPLTSFDELLAQFKAAPEKFVWGGGSAGSADHLLIGLIAHEAGVAPHQLNYVAYTGGGEAAAAVMGGQVAAGVAGYAEWKDLAEAKKMKLLAISSPKRFPGIDVPAIREFGLDIVLENWRFVVAGPGIKPEERATLLAMITHMRDSGEWRAILDKYYWEDRFLTGPELEDFIAEETSATARLLGELGMGALGEGYATTGPYLFPVIILALLALLAGALVFQHFRRSVVAGGGAEADADEPMSWRKFAVSALLILGFVFTLGKIGFFYATPPYLVAQARLMGGGKTGRDVIVAVFFTAAVFLVFEKILLISVP